MIMNLSGRLVVMEGFAAICFKGVVSVLHSEAQTSEIENVLTSLAESAGKRSQSR